MPSSSHHQGRLLHLTWKTWSPFTCELRSSAAPPHLQLLLGLGLDLLKAGLSFAGLASSEKEHTMCVGKQ